MNTLFNSRLGDLCRLIQMPEDAIASMENRSLSLTEDETQIFISDLCDKEKYADATKKLETLLTDNEYGFAELLVMLTAALRSQKLYEEKGIDEQIFIDTMKCFSRFVREHKESYGVYGFDRGFWVGRQLSLCLFRLGELEYETESLDGEKAISVHIPSDADLSAEKISLSLALSKQFFSSYDPEYANKKYYCCSWLLSPALKELLPESSKILGFSKRFQLIRTFEEDEGYKQWVYKDKRLSPEQFPENTSLQRNMKKYVLNGGKIGEGLGILLSD